MLACPASQGFSQSHAASVDTQLLSILLSNSSIDHPPVIITCDMVANAIKSLAFKKAAGPDGLSAEHFVYGPVDSLATILALVFQAIIFPILSAWPTLFPSSRVGPWIPIILLTIGASQLGLLFVRCLSQSILLSEFLSPLSHRLHALQGRFRSGLSTSHTSYILNECIMSCRERNSKCYKVFLDARKAFDTVWHSGLFVKLFDLQINFHIWYTLFFWYRHLMSCVKWAGGYSRSFRIGQGVPSFIYFVY